VSLRLARALIVGTFMPQGIVMHQTLLAPIGASP
jgi:hypothetical protein